MGEVIHLNSIKNQSDEEICLDSIVESWTDSLVSKVQEIYRLYGVESAYHFFSRLTGHEMEMTKMIVDIYLDE